MKDGEKGGNSKLLTLKETKFKIINYSSTTTEFPHIYTSSLFVMLKELLMMFMNFEEKKTKNLFDVRE